MFDCGAHIHRISSESILFRQDEHVFSFQPIHQLDEGLALHRRHTARLAASYPNRCVLPRLISGRNRSAMTKTLTWKSVDSPPGSDTTVLLFDPAAPEPVWLGCLDGAIWRFVDGMSAAPTYWTEIPGGPET
jgi:hypothetical protein